MKLFMDALTICGAIIMAPFDILTMGWDGFIDKVKEELEGF